MQWLLLSNLWPNEQKLLQNSRSKQRVFTFKYALYCTDWNGISFFNESQNSRQAQFYQSTWINRLNKLHCSSLYIKSTCLFLWAISSKSIYPPIYSYSPNYSFILHIQTAVNKLINCSGLLFSLLLNFNWFTSLVNPCRLVVLALFPFLAWRQIQWMSALTSHFTNHL